MRLWFFPGSLCKVTTGRWEKVNWPRGEALRGVEGWPGHQFLIDIISFLVVQMSQKFDNMLVKKKKKVRIDVFTLRMLLGWWITPGSVSHSSRNKCGLHSVRMHFGFLGRVLSVQSTSHVYLCVHWLKTFWEADYCLNWCVSALSSIHGYSIWLRELLVIIIDWLANFKSWGREKEK